MAKYTPNSHEIDTVLGWVKSGEIAIPDIQRPFVWEAAKVRNLLDSMYKDYPIGYLIIWKNPNVKLKNGKDSEGKKILIDGQQRVTALMVALLGEEVVTKEYKKVRIRIAFNPQKQTFEVTNTAIQKDPAWIPDISILFQPGFDLRGFGDDYTARNPGVDVRDIDSAIRQLQLIVRNGIGIIELSSALDIETVTEIFVRVNSTGVELNQSDFAMSKIAVNHNFGGSNLRKAIDYFCHLAARPESYSYIQNNDREFASSEYFSKMAWLRDENDDLYDPKYSDMLRVAFTSQFGRGRLQDLVALLSGRNFETKQNEEAIIEDTFKRLSAGVLNFINESHFKRFIMIIKSAGFVSSSMIGSVMTLNFAYILYLTLRNRQVDNAIIEREVRRWFVLSMLTGRYSSSPETAIDQDMRQIEEQGIQAFVDTAIRGQLSEAFWETQLPQDMNTPSANSPYFNVFRAAQVKMGDLGFLSRDITVKDLLEQKSDAHHVFPQNILKKENLQRSQYNQIANFVIAQSEINIQISNKAPNVYFSQMLEQVNGGPMTYGNINTPEELRRNLAMHCIPEGIESMTVRDYQAFLQARRSLMARKIQAYFQTL